MARIITISNSELQREATRSSLSSSATSGDNTISLYSISGFTTNQILLIGEFGQEGSEIIKTHASTAPSGTTVTLASNLAKSHPKDVKAYVLPFDQVQFYHAATTTGTKTLLSTSDVDEESVETTYKDTTYSSGYFFNRFLNSINSSYSEYSDPIPYAGFDSNTVGYMINLVMSQMRKDFGKHLTYDMLIEEINACLRYIRGKLKTWSNVQEFDYVVDQMNRGEYSWSLPTTYYDKNSNRSMLQVRVGSDDALIYQDKREFDEYFEDVVVSQVATQAEVDDTSLVLDSTADFPTSGTVTVYVSNTAYNIDFTANDKDTNTLTTEAITVQIPVDTNVWYGESESTPRYFSIWDGSLYIWPLIDSTDYGKNIYADFYTDIVEVDSDGDEISLARHDMIKHWLKWQIRNITERNGNQDTNDGDWLVFNAILSDAIRRESSGQKRRMHPKINRIDYRGEGRVINQSFDVE